MRPQVGLLLRAVRLVWTTHSLYATCVILLSLIESTVGAGMIWTVKLLVDAAVAAGGVWGEPSVLSILVLLGVILGGGQAARALRSMAQGLLQNLLVYRVNYLIIEKAAQLDLAYFEQASYYDRLQNAQREAGFRPLSLVQESLRAFQSAGSLVAIAGILLWVSPIATVLIALAFGPLLLVQSRFGRQGFELAMLRTPDARRMTYLSHLLTVDESAKEVKLFQLAPPLLRQYAVIFRRFYRQDRSLLVRREIAIFLASLLTLVPLLGVAGFLLESVAAGRLTVGDLLLFTQGIVAFSAGAFGLAFALGQLFEGTLFLSNLFGFLDFAPPRRITGGDRPVPRPLTEGIRFEGVSFSYPGGAVPVLREVSFAVPAGGVVALVGENGAGKTTLVKLLTRLYDPDVGTIWLDGRPIGDYDIDDLHSQIAVIFQDFVRYHATARENIGYGRIERSDDEIAVRSAARQAGADTILERLPDGYDTMLGKWFEDGHDLSAGQWQAVALARAFLRDGQLLVLDEPTASLDARAEFELFRRFRDLARGRTVLLISHRFSTVQHADQIVVLEEGHVAEQGTHSELIASNGLYAELFNRQAMAYR